ncbi:MAG TPA: hypothetical protein VF142_06350 [Longimicrobium sp.]
MSDSNPAGAVVPDLIRLREQLTGWIARLDEVGPQASSRVAERVRADYVDRLRRVNEDLASHRGEIEADLAGFRAALAEAEEMRGRAADELDELSLRHLIGELDEGAWDEARPSLERRVADADDAVSRARAEVEHLERLAADIAGAAETPAAPPPLPSLDEPTPSAGSIASHEPPPLPGADEPAAPAPEEPESSFGEPEAAAQPEPQPSIFSAADEFEPDLPSEPEPRAEAAAPAADATLEAPPADAREAAEAASGDEWDPFGSEFTPEPKQGDAEEDLPWLEGIDEAARGWTPPAADLGADDLAFLEELDRAIGSSAASGGAKSSTPPPAQPAGTPPAAPASGSGGARAEPLLCKECGAINEPHSWYCEICGSEL